jgi:hypothetical protein
MEQLQTILAEQVLSDHPDRMYWRLDPKGRFTVRSLYRFMVDPGCREQRLIDVWSTKLALKHLPVDDVS